MCVDPGKQISIMSTQLFFSENTQSPLVDRWQKWSSSAKKGQCALLQRQEISATGRQKQEQVVKTSKMLLWHWSCSFFLKNVAVTNKLEGYPSSLFILGLQKSLLLIKPMVFHGFGVHFGEITGGGSVNSGVRYLAR